MRLGVLVGVGAPCQPDTLGQREGVDQKQLGERLHLFGVRLVEYHVFLVVGLVAIVSDLVRPLAHRRRDQMVVGERINAQLQGFPLRERDLSTGGERRRRTEQDLTGTMPAALKF